VRHHSRLNEGVMRKLLRGGRAWRGPRADERGEGLNVGGVTGPGVVNRHGRWMGDTGRQGGKKTGKRLIELRRHR